MTMEERVGNSLAKPRLYAVLLVAFATAALVANGSPGIRLPPAEPMAAIAARAQRPKPSNEPA
jgi:hypothetical protein